MSLESWVLEKVVRLRLPVARLTPSVLPKVPLPAATRFWPSKVRLEPEVISVPSK